MARACVIGRATSIAGNNYGGVTIVHASTVGNVVQGNFIGTDASGSFPLGNSHGLWVQGASNNTIGGNVPAAGNMIVSNRAEGIVLRDGASNNAVRYNSIGTDATGQAFLGNALSGVAIINTSSGNYVWDNKIAYNGGSGIQVGTSAADLSVGNWLSRNAIFANAALGISLGGSGMPTPNHEGFLPGPNNFQNYPEQIEASSDGVNTTVDGTFHSTPTTDFVLEFFYNDVLDPSGFGQGQEYAHSSLTLIVTTDATGVAPPFHFTLMGGMPGRYLTATATDLQGNTSEFSAGVQITDASAASAASRRSAAWALAPVEVLRSVAPVMRPYQERAVVLGPFPQAQSVLLASGRPEVAAVDDFFGGAWLRSQGTTRHQPAAALSKEDASFVSAGVWASDDW
jgi:hypothetical protein